MSIDKYNKSQESEYCKSYSYSSEAKEERSTLRDSHHDDERGREVNDNNGRYPYSSGTRSIPRIIYMVFGILCLLAISFGMLQLLQLGSLTEKEVVQEAVEPTVEEKHETVIIPEATSQSSSEMQSEEEQKGQHHNPTISNEKNVDEPVTSTAESLPVASNSPKEESSPTSVPEPKATANVKKDSESGTPKRELTTLEILERKNHANVVKQAQRAGVSTEGSTMEILERINHANVVKQAKRAGVSTEGSTMEILERISRKELEKWKN